MSDTIPTARQRQAQTLRDLARLARNHADLLRAQAQDLETEAAIVEQLPPVVGRVERDGGVTELRWPGDVAPRSAKPPDLRLVTDGPGADQQGGE